MFNDVPRLLPRPSVSPSLITGRFHSLASFGKWVNWVGGALQTLCNPLEMLFRYDVSPAHAHHSSLCSADFISLSGTFSHFITYFCFSCAKLVLQQLLKCKGDNHMSSFSVLAKATFWAPFFFEPLHNIKDLLPQLTWLTVFRACVFLSWSSSSSSGGG